MFPDDYLSDIGKKGFYTTCAGSRNSLFAEAARYNNTNPFKIGDAVCLKNGAAKMLVLSVNGSHLVTQYASSRKINKSRHYKDFMFFVETTSNSTTDNSEQGNDTMQVKLYEVVGETKRYGVVLARDSDGKLVLKMHDTNQFEAFEESQLKRVMPYTFDVQFIGTGNVTVYSYRGKEGQVEVGDILLLDNTNTLARVVDVNTESEKATKAFEGVKLSTVRLSQ